MSTKRGAYEENLLNAISASVARSRDLATLTSSLDQARARIAELEKALVTAVIPLEAMNAVGLDKLKFVEELKTGIYKGITAVRAALAGQGEKA